MAELNVRQSAKTSIERLYTNQQSGALNTDRVSITYLRVTKENLETHYGRFCAHHEELVGQAADAAELNAHMELFNEVEEKYTQVKSHILEILEPEEVVVAEEEEEEKSSVHTQQSGEPGVKPQFNLAAGDLRLEKIKLPDFDGAFHNWIAFRDMFEGMVHNQAALSVPAKYTRLMRSLQGEAKQVVAGFLPTDSNYEEAWDTLKSRYDNKRLIVNSHLAIFLNLEVLSKETSVGLRKIIDTTNQTTRSLKALQRPVEQWDDILVHIITSKLPRATIVDWEKQQKGNELPFLKDLLELMASRARGLEHMGPNTSEKATKSAATDNTTKQKAGSSGANGTSKSLRSNLAVTPKSTCPYCKGQHSIGRCDKLMAFSPADRFQELKGSNLCYNCLTPGHGTRQCKSERNCRNCNGRHHTILCRTPTNAIQGNANTSQQANQENQATTSNSSNA